MSVEPETDWPISEVGERLACIEAKVDGLREWLGGPQPLFAIEQKIDSRLSLVATLHAQGVAENAMREPPVGDGVSMTEYRSRLVDALDPTSGVEGLVGPREHGPHGTDGE